jgi:hypothetical protein
VRRLATHVERNPSRAAVTSVALQLVIHYVDAAQRVFATGRLTVRDCLLTLTLALMPVSLIELTKLLRHAAGGTRLATA